MSRIVFAPDTNFFLDQPNFVAFFGSARSVVHLDILWPVLCELDSHRSRRNGNRQDARDRGNRAYEAIKLIRYLQEHPSEDLELEISTPEGIEPSLPPDAQIVAHVVRLATEQHPNDTIEFITNDEGLPTLWFIEEKKRRGLKNINVKTTEELRKQIAAYGTPAASIEQVGIAPTPSTREHERGIDLFLDCTVLDMRGRQVSIGIYRHQESNAFTHQTLDVPTATFRKPRLTFFLPYSRLGVTPKRYGMQHARLKIVVWDLEHKKILARYDDYSIEMALGGYYLTTYAHPGERASRSAASKGGASADALAEYRAE